MYLLEDQIERNSLRQGDIISEVHLLGTINLSTISYMVSNDTRIGWYIPKPPDFRPAIILSHSCEIDLLNDIKLTSIILAPLRDINKATGPQQIEELKQSNIIDESSTYSYLKYFYIEPNPLIPFDDGAIVDFSKCFSVRNQSYKDLLSKKIIQMRKDIANKMALKLSLFFYRPEETA